jgi:xylan 1,4-beta-xylosidase
LTLTAPPERGTNLMGGVLGRPITSGDFAATAIVMRSGLEPGVIAGLATLGDRANSTGVALVDDRIILWNRARDTQTILAQAEVPAKSRQVHFRVLAANGKQYQFSFSGDGQNWTDILPQTSGAHLPPWDRAVRVGMTVGGARQAEAKFDSFEIQAIEPQ